MPERREWYARTKCGYEQHDSQVGLELEMLHRLSQLDELGRQRTWGPTDGVNDAGLRFTRDRHAPPAIAALLEAKSSRRDNVWRQHSNPRWCEVPRWPHYFLHTEVSSGREVGES